MLQVEHMFLVQYLWSLMSFVHSAVVSRNAVNIELWGMGEVYEYVVKGFSISSISLTSSNKKLLETSATLLGTGTLLVVTRKLLGASACLTESAQKNKTPKEGARVAR